MNSNPDSEKLPASGKSLGARLRFGVGMIFTVLYWPIGVVVMAACCLITRLFLGEERHRRLGQGLLSWVFVLFLGGLERIGILRVDDAELREHAKQPGPYIIACNHPALWDAPMILRRFGGLSGIMKSEAFANPLLGIGARFAGFLPNEPHLKMVKMALGRLENHDRLLFFPEGTRTREENVPLNPFRPGMALLVKQSGVPVLPVLISANSQYLRKGWPLWKMPGLPILVKLQVGESFIIEPDESVREFSDRLERYFRENLGG